MFENFTNNNNFGAPVGSAPIPGTPVAVKPIKFTNPLTKEDRDIQIESAKARMKK